MKKLLLSIVVLVLFGFFIADMTLPPSMLNKGYDDCRKDDSKREPFCACVRDGMRSWKIKDYAFVALRMAELQAENRMPEELETLAQQCIERTATAR